MRIESLRASMEKSDLDAYIVSNETNIYYYTGTISGGVLVLSHESEPVLLVPRLNLAIAQAQALGCEITPYTLRDLFDKVVEKLAAPESVGFDAVTLDFYLKLQERFDDIKLCASPDLVWNMRRVKDSSEQKLMTKAGELADVGMEAIRNHLEIGMREHEIAAEACYAMMRGGAEGIAFDFIVASGPRSAYPHAGVTDRGIRKGDFVKVDMGATYKGYRSDLTRTFIVGEPSEKQAEMYDAVLRANEEALPEIRDGAKGSDVDKVARGVIEEAGYGEYFVHALGHGVGLEVHEPPSLSETSGDILKTGNVVTDEPGIYIPGFGGVRIEDTVLITASGPATLTRFDKDLDSMRV